jgi:hypothetical protein
MHAARYRYRRRGRIGSIVAAALVLSAAGGTAAAALAVTSVKPYIVQVGSGYDAVPLLSAGDTVPLIGDPSKQYRMVGIPDGLGVYRTGPGTSTLYMNHELTSGTESEPVVGGPKNRGAIVSKWILDSRGNPIAGRRAYDTVYSENTLIGPAPEAGNSTRAFTRFCSSFLAGPPDGFDRWIYLTNEESSGSDTFEGNGGLSVAIFDGELHTLPKLGRYAKENTVVQHRVGNRTVIFSMEDGPASLDSQLYMYVGKKDRRSGAGALARNGLDNGALYVFRSLDTSRNSELAVQSGSVTGEWVEIPGADTKTAAELESAVDALGAFTFVRPEDAAFNPRNPNELFFVTTGGNKAQGNELGRLYSLRLHPGNVLQNATLTVVYNADQVIAAGGDVAISPDNVDASFRYLMINEDGTAESRPVMAAKGRDGSIWRFELRGLGLFSPGVDASTATRVAELDPPGRDGVAVGAGIWETSGIIDAGSIFGPDTWLTDVQAHPPTAPPGGSAVTVEDGQLLLLRPKH